jgi:hypothetical protein
LAITWPPHLLQNFRSLIGVFEYVAIFSAPAVTFTASGFQSEKALTGPPDQERHERQWQYPMAWGSPVTSICTAPQKHSPLWVVMERLPSVVEGPILVPNADCG